VRLSTCPLVAQGPNVHHRMVAESGRAPFDAASLHVPSGTRNIGVRLSSECPGWVTITFGDRQRIGQFASIADRSSQLVRFAVSSGINLPSDIAHVMCD